MPSYSIPSQICPSCNGPKRIQSKRCRACFVAEHPSVSDVLVRRTARGEGSSACWMWTGAKQTGGYGVMGMPGTDQTQYVHVLAYGEAGGVIPKGGRSVIPVTCAPALGTMALKTPTKSMASATSGSAISSPLRDWRTCEMQ